LGEKKKKLLSKEGGKHNVRGEERRRIDKQTEKHLQKNKKRKRPAQRTGNAKKTILLFNKGGERGPPTKWVGKKDPGLYKGEALF